jgi:hypothetical protein
VTWEAVSNPDPHALEKALKMLFARPPYQGWKKSDDRGERRQSGQQQELPF